MMLHDLPHWEVIYQQNQRWSKAGVFEAIVDDLRTLLRVTAGRVEQPSAVLTAGRYNQRLRAVSGLSYDGGKRKKGSKVHIAVDTLGHLLVSSICDSY